MYFPTDRTHFPGKKLFQIIPIRFPSKGGPGGNIIPYPNWGTTSPCNRMAHDGTTKPMFFFCRGMFLVGGIHTTNRGSY